jgi:phosphopantetheine adenylyltransferase
MIEIKATEELSLKKNKGDYDVYVEDVSVEYGQDTVDEEDYQILKVSTENNGVARYINISTEKWSFSDIDDLIQILEDFKRRASL